jgi:hypothetical protein
MNEVDQSLPLKETFKINPGFSPVDFSLIFIGIYIMKIKTL